MRAAKGIDEFAMAGHSQSLSFVASMGNMICSTQSATCRSVPDELDLSIAAHRLKWARQQAKFATAADFARRVHINPITYRAYEEDQNGFARHAAKFAKVLGVPTDWLLSGGKQPAVTGSADPFVPPADLLALIMESALHGGRTTPARQAELRVAARGVGRALRMIAKNPARVDDPDFRESVAEIAAEEAFHHAQQSSSQ